MDFLPQKLQRIFFENFLTESLLGLRRVDQMEDFSPHPRHRDKDKVILRL